MGNRLPKNFIRLGAIALVMRLPVVVLAPILGGLRRDYDLSAAAAGLLTALPVVCFAVFAIPAGALLRRFGLHRAVAVALLVLVGAGAVRVLGGELLLFAGTAMIGCALAVLNVAVVVIIAEWFPKAGLPTGVQIASSNVGSAIASAAVVPLAAGVGWRAATAMFGVVIIISLLFWRSPQALSQIHDITSHQPAQEASPGWVIVLLVAVTFAGHNLSYYGMTTWLPTLVTASGGVSPATGGLAASLFQAFGIAGALLVPLLAARGCSTLILMVLAGVAWLSLPTGLLFAPTMWLLWVLAGGLAQGGMFAVIIAIIVAAPGAVSSLASKSQTIGYTAAAAGPVVLGAVHDVSGGWSVPLAVVQSAMALMMLTGVTAVITTARRSSTPAGVTPQE